ncbi:hypothetical protein B0H14DRAFT_3743976 [Mycena olivaceomarginata]|nr:hypothetical protein B0H14DRAFT_3743976 [Mycena olivaceomarginata]
MSRRWNRHVRVQNEGLLDSLERRQVLCPVASSMGEYNGNGEEGGSKKQFHVAGHGKPLEEDGGAALDTSLDASGADMGLDIDINVDMQDLTQGPAADHELYGSQTAAEFIRPRSELGKIPPEGEVEFWEDQDQDHDEYEWLYGLPMGDIIDEEMERELAQFETGPSSSPMSSGVSPHSTSKSQFSECAFHTPPLECRRHNRLDVQALLNTIKAPSARASPRVAVYRSSKETHHERGISQYESIDKYVFTTNSEAFKLKALFLIHWLFTRVRLRKMQG